MEFYDFPFSWGMSSSQLTTSIIFQRGRLKPPNQAGWFMENPNFVSWMMQFMGYPHDLGKLKKRQETFGISCHESWGFCHELSAASDWKTMSPSFVFKIVIPRCPHKKKGNKHQTVLSYTIHPITRNPHLHSIFNYISITSSVYHHDVPIFIHFIYPLVIKQGNFENLRTIDGGF